MHFLVFLSFLSIHRAQQPRSGWPSKVFRRFDRRFGVVFNTTQIWAARIWKCSNTSERWNKFLVYEWSPYVVTKFDYVEYTHPWEPFASRAPPPKIAQRKRANSLITHRWIIRFHSNTVQSLNAWHPKCSESLRSRGQRSRSRRKITYHLKKAMIQARISC